MREWLIPHLSQNNFAHTTHQGWWWIRTDVYINKLHVMYVYMYGAFCFLSISTFGVRFLFAAYASFTKHYNLLWMHP
jgi:hypothetical protein